MVSINKVTTPGGDLDACIQLFKDYAAELNVDLCFQGFTEELNDPLKLYGGEKGCLLLAHYNNELAGCVALKPRGDAVCEMKRLYTAPAFRKFGVGDRLVTDILQQAVKMGYATMVLDTLERLQPAIRLYKRHGFIQTNAYYHNPNEGVVYMQKQLFDA